MNMFVSLTRTHAHMHTAVRARNQETPTQPNTPDSISGRDALSRAPVEHMQRSSAHTLRALSQDMAPGARVEYCNWIECYKRAVAP
jgi:hypothetical protein